MSRLVRLLVCSLMLAVIGCSKSTPPPPPPPTAPAPTSAEGEYPRPHKPLPPLTAEERERALYAFGVALAQVATPIGQLGLSATEVKQMTRGLEDALDGKAPSVPPEVGTPLSDRLVKLKTLERAEAEKKRGEDFLSAQGKMKGAQTLPSGVVVIPEKEGQGASPTPSDRVKVDFVGFLMDGSQFDSSEKHGGPGEFLLSQGLKCWTEGIQTMKAGGRAKLVCPPHLAYGPRGFVGVPRNSTLSYEIELLAIIPPASGADASVASPSPHWSSSGR